MGGRAVQNLHFGWQSVLVHEHVHCPDETTYHVTTFFVSALSVLLNHNQLSVVGSCNNSAMFQIVKHYNSFRIPEYRVYDFAGWCEHAKLSGRWRSDMFPGHTLCFTFRIKVVKPGLVYHYKSWNKVVQIFVEQSEKTCGCFSTISFLNIGQQARHQSCRINHRIKLKSP